MQNSSHTSLVLLSVVSIIAATFLPAEAKWTGKVERADAKRLTRPLDGFASQEQTQIENAQTTKYDSDLSALVDQKQFSVEAGKEDSSNCNQKATIDWPELLPARATSITLPARTQSTEPAVDYDAIEQAYAEAAPRHPVTANTRRSEVPACATSAAAVNCQVAAQQAYLNAGMPGPRVSLDLCACDMPVPSSACMQNRTMGLYGNPQNPPPPTMHRSAPFPTSGAVSPGVAVRPVTGIPAAQTVGLQVGR